MMKFCAKFLSGATTIFTSVATIVMIIAVFTPSWRHLQPADDGHPVKQGLWQTCHGGTFEFKECSLLVPVNTVPVRLNVVRGLAIVACIGFLLAFGTNLRLNSGKVTKSHKGMGVLYTTTVTMAGILAIVAAQIYSRHLDHNKENCEALSMTPTQDSTQLGFCVYLAYTAGILGLAALFVSSLTLIMTRDNGYQRLKESPIGKF